MNGPVGPGAFACLPSVAAALIAPLAGTKRPVARQDTTTARPPAAGGAGPVTPFAPPPSPDGKVLAFAAGGAGARDWWRKGGAHWDECALWLRRDGTGTLPAYDQLTPDGTRDLWPLWAPDGRRLYFASDRGGSQNLWAA